MCKLFSVIDWNSVVSALVGGAIAGFFSLRAVDRSAKKDSEMRKKEEESLLNAFLLSIRDEVDTLWDRYMWGIGEELEKLPENQAFLWYYPITQSYFSVYDNNSSLIGKIKDNNLRKLIIITYTQAKGLIDSYRFNNEMVKAYEDFSLAHRQTNDPTFEEKVKAELAALIRYAEAIKKQHNEIKENIAELLKRLSNL